MKYAAYKFTAEQIAQYEVKMFFVLGFNEDLTFACDDIYSMVLVCIHTLKSIIQPEQGQEYTNTNAKWVEDQAMDLLEMTYFNHELLVKVLPEVLASAIVISALTVLTQSKTISVYQPFQNAIQSQSVVVAKLADYWGVSQKSLCKVTQALMQWTFSKHLLSTF